MKFTKFISILLVFFFVLMNLITNNKYKLRNKYRFYSNSNKSTQFYRRVSPLVEADEVRNVAPGVVTSVGGVVRPNNLPNGEWSIPFPISRTPPANLQSPNLITRGMSGVAGPPPGNMGIAAAGVMPQRRMAMFNHPTAPISVSGARSVPIASRHHPPGPIGSPLPPNSGVYFNSMESPIMNGPVSGVPIHPHISPNMVTAYSDMDMMNPDEINNKITSADKFMNEGKIDESIDEYSIIINSLDKLKRKGKISKADIDKILTKISRSVTHSSDHVIDKIGEKFKSGNHSDNEILDKFLSKLSKIPMKNKHPNLHNSELDDLGDDEEHNEEEHNNYDEEPVHGKHGEAKLSLEPKKKILRHNPISNDNEKVNSIHTTDDNKVDSKKTSNGISALLSWAKENEISMNNVEIRFNKKYDSKSIFASKKFKKNETIL